MLRISSRLPGARALEGKSPGMGMVCGAPIATGHYRPRLGVRLKQTAARCCCISTFANVGSHGALDPAILRASFRILIPLLLPAVHFPEETGMPTQQGSLKLLQDPVAQTLLHSTSPARFAYMWPDN